MDRQRYALTWLLALLLTYAAEGQTSLRPQAGVLLLRNGQVLSGLITRAGDYYIVTINAGSEVRERASEVEAFCGSLDEVYEFKQRHLPGSGARPHLDLAEWCLRNGLHGRCAQQLVAAMRLEPENQRLKDLERRLELAVTPPPAPVEPPAAVTATIGPDQLEKALRALPPGSVEKFTAVVQPILLNRCGNNQCHGPAAKSDFRLLRPAEGQIASRRFTQRNLYATLAQLDLGDPESSPLITLPQRQHGSALVPVFDKQTQNQLAELIAWARLTAARPTAAPATIGPTSATLSQPAAAASSGAARVDAMRPPLDASSASRPAESPRPFTPRDRYDPEIFNRRYHAK
jgi:hypothetical protein